MPEYVTYEARLSFDPGTVVFVADLLTSHWHQLRTRAGRRALSAWDQAVMWLRWLHDGTRVIQLARDHGIGLSTCYRDLDETTKVLAARAPSLRSALLAAKFAGYTYLIVDGTIVRTDRCRQPGPTKGVHLWWSGKIRAHGGNLQEVTAPDGHPIWFSPVRPGREYDITCTRAHDLHTVLARDWNCNADGACGCTTPRRTLADTAYLGEPAAFTTPIRTPRNGQLSANQKFTNHLTSALRAPGERANALLKNFKALRRVTRHPRTIGPLARAALVLIHHTTGRQV